MNLNPTTIEWVKNLDGTQGFTWNPITGCLNGCEYCYACKLANGRLRSRYLANTHIAHQRNPLAFVEAEFDPFYPRFWEDRMPYLRRYPKGGFGKAGKGIFPCDMGDLFGKGVPKEWTEKVLSTIRYFGEHRFYLLTKQLETLVQFSPFPANAWVGVTATDDNAYTFATHYLEKVEAKVKYISFEPLLTVIDCGKPWDKRLKLAGIQWVIIGAQTRPTIYPKIEWVREICQACDKAGIPVFLKNNLKLPEELPFYDVIDEDPMLTPRLRQELPKERNDG